MFTTNNQSPLSVTPLSVADVQALVETYRENVLVCSAFALYESLKGDAAPYAVRMKDELVEQVVITTDLASKPGATMTIRLWSTTVGEEPVRVSLQCTSPDPDPAVLLKEQQAILDFNVIGGEENHIWQLTVFLDGNWIFGCKTARALGSGFGLKLAETHINRELSGVAG